MPRKLTQEVEPTQMSFKLLLKERICTVLNLLLAKYIKHTLPEKSSENVSKIAFIFINKKINHYINTEQ